MVYWSVFDLPAKENDLIILQKKASYPDLWNNRENALKIMKDMADLQQDIQEWIKLQSRINFGLDLSKLGDESLRPELEIEINDIDKLLSQKEISLLLSGHYDRGDAILAIHAGAGGTDSQDWAAMLMRMYLRWAENSGYSVEVLDQTEGEEAGIKSVTISVNGLYAYGYLRPEKGVHRLVRLSPFDSAHRRHTSFGLVEVLPDIKDNDTGIQINPEDIRIDNYKSSGAGGQNVQKNATAIRITHLPSGLVVSCQNERSQMQNRENALRVLKSRLLEIQREEQDKHLADLRGEYTKAEWGSQIRSYVLHPYQMVKDHRTDFEVGNAQSVLDGEIDNFINAFLRYKQA